MYTLQPQIPPHERDDCIIFYYRFAKIKNLNDSYHSKECFRFRDFNGVFIFLLVLEERTDYFEIVKNEAAAQQMWTPIPFLAVGWIQLTQTAIVTV